MAWFSTHASAPTVTTASDAVQESYTYYGNTIWTYTKMTKTNAVETRGLTNAAADSKVAALLADSVNVITNISKYAIGAGGYNVRYTLNTSSDTWARN